MAHLSEMLGQMFMAGFVSDELSAREQSLFRQLGLGGFILFHENVADPERIAPLCRSLWNLGAGYPPFVAIDHEGGRVHRLPAPFTHFPAAAAIGERNDADLAYRVGKAVGHELALGGISLNFAPVLDVNSNAQNPIIGDRAFGSEPERVTRIGLAFARGLRAAGIIPCGKHFPGHGGTDRDSHVVLPTLEQSRELLRAVDLPPFEQTCRESIEALMTAHVLYPALDPARPATLSRNVVSGLLRADFGYAGVVFSDDLDMKAIRDNYGRDEAALLCIEAGVDVLLYGHDPDAAVRAFETISAQAQKSGALRRRIEESYSRIVNLKKRYLKKFTGIEGSLAAYIAALGHERLIADIYGSSYSV
jgi:beta-N-acetylhexosaminidase